MAKGPLTFKELEDMLKNFRCQDLCTLLAFAGSSKNGKKSELYERCLNLLEKGNVQIQKKIQEIHLAKSTQLAQNSTTTAYLLNQNSNSSTSSNSAPSTGTSITSHDMYSSTNSTRQHTNLHNSNFNNMQSNVLHSNFNSSLNLISSEIKLRKLAFYEVLHEIQKPIRLMPINIASRPHQFILTFQIPIKQLDEVTSSREFVDGKVEYSTQIQLRFALFDSSTEQPDNMPPNLNININLKPAPLPPPKPTSKPNSDLIRPGRAIDITHLCKLAPSSSNKIDIFWTNPDINRDYCCGIYVVRKLSTPILMDNLTKNPKKLSDYSRQLAIEKLSIQDNDLEIETSTLKASLICPLMKCRISIPGRSINCKHVQCFDLTSYLYMNEKKPTWNCPVCDRYAPYEDLVIDSYYSEILKKANDCEDIQFNSNGDWSRIEIIKKKSSSTTSTSNSVSNKTDTKDEVKLETKTQIDTNESVIQLTPVKEQQQQSEKPKEIVKSKEVVIDLTLDSDSEDEATSKKASNRSQSSNYDNERPSSAKNKLQEEDNLNQQRKRQSSSPISVISLSSTRSNTPNTSPQGKQMQVDDYEQRQQPINPSKNLLLSLDKSLQQQPQQPKSPNYSPSKSIASITTTTTTTSPINKMNLPPIPPQLQPNVLFSTTAPMPIPSNVISSQTTQRQQLPRNPTPNNMWQTQAIQQSLPNHPFNFSNGLSQNRFNQIPNTTLFNTEQTSRSISPNNNTNNRLGLLHSHNNKNKYPNKKPIYNTKDKAQLVYSDTNNLAINCNINNNSSTINSYKLAKDLQQKQSQTANTFNLDSNSLMNQQSKSPQYLPPQLAYSQQSTLNYNPFSNPQTSRPMISTNGNSRVGYAPNSNFNENYCSKKLQQTSSHHPLPQQHQQQSSHVPLPPHSGNLYQHNSS